MLGPTAASCRQGLISALPPFPSPSTLICLQQLQQLPPSPPSPGHRQLAVGDQHSRDILHQGRGFSLNFHSRSLSQQKALDTHAFTVRCCQPPLHDFFYDLHSIPDISSFFVARTHMPVPVPTRTPAHQINKPFSIDVHSSCLVKQSALKHLLTSLPAPPTGPPPAFTDRETWIKSLPAARRYKVRQEAVTTIR